MILISKIKNKESKIEIGFTLIELLVVIGIIAILSGISIFALQGARESGRDAKRKADLEVIRSGLELYKADCNRYPPSPLPDGINPLQGNSAYGPACSNSNTYISDVPEDPTSGARYRYVPVGTTSYSLCTGLEEPPSPIPAQPCMGCVPGPCAYNVKSP
ncbi:hypothetical protein A2715_01670 [Candidatus Woesebacteria bacterium RIFCSPHIGHO2_01_FULL_39_32]|uniref:General secretion pathway protein G n=2 Tax=Candidatus Woeseibacteriota TaxID=1752722 RepID=A0A0G0PS27_9BACT|nr:MAG: General secretion pathway protein G [Candidatus Woesebacteria bacterium GW2011_GWA1_39_8]OGM03841.1 MAG: hypothetical protein A2124_02530 [Candidatus Woesebacteria bacterium GWB1_37_5]OGM23867.1 MAG: hypothetical protein A2715_01670 [Candidatus Woesebacteria bacterium RIFCSPHIGHO2_01_FULL_39_32]OGM38668.1 MAG: hypothetical protein A3F01_02855 [Candidatus Woesebacteria bacterium RIFCSPHIGHO2_12_FULL_38_11]OGM64056.1 MAG: hypothetical protein A2893_02910 [Candidatus Woesebacteria bacteriu